MSELSEVTLVPIGVALVRLPVAAILVPRLWLKRRIIHLKVVDGSGQPARGVAIRVVRNRAGATSSATGDGHLISGQLYPIGHLAESDAQGHFETR